MKAVILAGGYGTRLSEETGVKPKPMVEIGDRPILWHVMKIYETAGIKDFVICCGYKGHIIKEYFLNYFTRYSDLTFDLERNAVTFHQPRAEPWRVTLIDTGEETMTGGRLKRVRDHIGDETFCLTYGDGVSDVDIASLVAFHRSHAKLATLTAVQPPGRFGVFSLTGSSSQVRSFTEKPKGDGAWINGGFFVLEPRVMDFIAGDTTVFEQGPLTQLARKGQLMAYRHTGFWQPMDTLRDKMHLCELWDTGEAPWAVWKPRFKSQRGLQAV